MLYYLNNCQNLDHLKRHGGNAIFDLWAHGRDQEIADALKPGDTCLVASYQGSGKAGRAKVVLAEYTLTGKRLVRSSEAPCGMVCVLDGTLESREVLPKSEAVHHSLYSRFFNKLGHFKQLSALRGA